MTSILFQVQFRTGPNTVKIMGGLSSLTIYDLRAVSKRLETLGWEITNVCNPGMGKHIGLVALYTMGLDDWV